MTTPSKPCAPIYLQMRESALNLKPRDLTKDGVHAVLMDWNVGNGTATVLAAADGSASIYLSSGGGYIGGGQGHAEIRKAALYAIQIATDLLSHFEVTDTLVLPMQGDVYFYLMTNAGVRLAIATDVALRAGTDPLGPLGGIMQQIVTEYRLRYPQPAKS